jgi:hypothetical protein
MKVVIESTRMFFFLFYIQIIIMIQHYYLYKNVLSNYEHQLVIIYDLFFIQYLIIYEMIMIKIILCQYQKPHV